MQTFWNKNSNLAVRYENDFDISVLKITALWAFSESAFGGILHALTLPLRGLFISSASVLFISLIALFSKTKKDILKSTLIVILIKALVSPHSPLSAYFAVSIQGILGYVLFLPKNGYRISAFILGILALVFSGAQKIIILTIIFSNTLWKSINLFIQDVSADFLGLNIPSGIQYGHLIVIIYLSLHLLAGIFIGYYAGLLPARINHYWKNIPEDILNESNSDFPTNKKKKRRKSWLLRPTGIIILIISLSLLLYTYLYPSYKKIVSLEIIIMLLRALVLTIIWYIFLAPFLKRIFQKYISNKKSAYAQDINEIINLFPKFRKIVSYCWQNSSERKRISRIRYFLSTSFYYLLLIK